jgi:hypothetical protein
VSENTFYCFVDFAPERPKVDVIPAKTVSQMIKRGHREWLSTPGKGGIQHNDSGMRKIDPNLPLTKQGWMNEYFEHWDLVVSPHP